MYNLAVKEDGEVWWTKTESEPKIYTNTHYSGTNSQNHKDIKSNALEVQ